MRQKVYIYVDSDMKMQMCRTILEMLQYIIITTICLFWTHRTHGIVWRNPKKKNATIVWWGKPRKLVLMELCISTSNNICLENKWSWPNLWQDVKKHCYKYCCPSYQVVQSIAINLDGMFCSDVEVIKYLCLFPEKVTKQIQQTIDQSLFYQF